MPVNESFKINTDVLSQILVSKNLSNFEFSKKSNVPLSIINTIFHGGSASKEVIQSITDFLKCDFNDLVIKPLPALLSGKINLPVIESINYRDVDNIFSNDSVQVFTNRIKGLLSELLSDLSEDPDQRLMEVVGRIDAFRDEATPQLQSALNLYLRNQASETVEDKEKIVATVTSSIDKLGLAVSHNGQPCNFTTTVGKDYPNGRFLLTAKGGRVPLLARTKLADFLPLELTDAHPHREGSEKWAETEQARRSAKLSHERSD